MEIVIRRNTRPCRQPWMQRANLARANAQEVKIRLPCRLIWQPTSPVLRRVIQSTTNVLKVEMLAIGKPPITRAEQRPNVLHSWQKQLHSHRILNHPSHDCFKCLCLLIVCSNLHAQPTSCGSLSKLLSLKRTIREIPGSFTTIVGTIWNATKSRRRSGANIGRKFLSKLYAIIPPAFFS